MLSSPGMDRPQIDGHGQQAHSYGYQRQLILPITDTVPHQVVAVNAGPTLWRLSVVGEVVVDIIYGTQPRLSLQCDAPLEATFPGALTVTLTRRQHIAGGTVTAVVTLTRADGPGINYAARLYNAAAGAIALPDAAKRAVALGAAALTVRGNAVALAAAGDSVPLVEPSVLTAGLAIVEFAI